MKKMNVFFLAVGLVIIGASSVLAATYTLTATDKIYSPVWSNFSLQYNDLDNDQKFSYDELIPGTFSGVTYNSTTYTLIHQVPVYNNWDSPYTDGGGLYGEGKEYWAFATYDFSDAVYPPPSAWTYAQTPVPVPPAAWLFGSGLIGLAGLRRRVKGSQKNNGRGTFFPSAR